MILLIADLHLSPDLPKITCAFKVFLQTQAVKADKLFILGDFFNYWLGDDAISEFEQDIAQSLANVAQNGTKVYLMHGNRDFLIGEQFCKLAKCELIFEPYLLQVQPQQPQQPQKKIQNILLMHGDVLCTKDVGYLRMRKILRNKLVLTLLKHTPLKLRQKLAQTLRGQSKKRTRYKNSNITDVTSDAVIAIMNKFNVKTLIHGHTHRANIHNLIIDKKNAQRIVLGDWRPNTYYALITQNNIELKFFTVD